MNNLKLQFECLSVKFNVLELRRTCYGFSIEWQEKENIANGE